MYEDINRIETEIDTWLGKCLDRTIPRYKYIYHCNLAYIDCLVEHKYLFSPFEKHLQFSLNYNTYLAYEYLQEEEEFDCELDFYLYPIAFRMIIDGMFYAKLCDIFPLLHSGKAQMSVEGNDIYFHISNLPRKNYKYINDYIMRKQLSYSLQYASGLLRKCDDDDIAMKLADIYMHFWNENMFNTDYEPYTAMEWGGISFFFIVAAMRRFNKLYESDFDIVSVGSQKMMIVMSPHGTKEMRSFVPSDDDKLYDMALEDHIYKPIGNLSNPKSNISDTPLIKTKDGYIFTNPFVILFNDSMETQFMNYLRRSDNPRYLRIKDKVKEREIPLIIEMFKCKFPKSQQVSNFEVKIPNERKRKRECDVLIVDENGIGLYIELKHFYNPQSFCEIKVLDKELTAALDKMPKQLEAIRLDWDNIKRKKCLKDYELNKLYGVVVSHRYTGYDVEIKPNIPIVNVSNLYESIIEAKDIEEVYFGCQEIDMIYPEIDFIKRQLGIVYANYVFHVEYECLNPIAETIINQSIKKQAYSEIKFDRPKTYQSIKELAKAYIDIGTDGK